MLIQWFRKLQVLLDLLNLILNNLEIRLLLKHVLQFRLQLYSNMTQWCGILVSKSILTTESPFKHNFYFSPKGISDKILS